MERKLVAAPAQLLASIPNSVSVTDTDQNPAISSLIEPPECMKTILRLNMHSLYKDYILRL